MLTDYQKKQIKAKFQAGANTSWISKHLNIPESIVCGVLKIPYLSPEYQISYFIKHRNQVLRYMEHDSFTRDKLDPYIDELNKYIDNLQRNL